MAQLEKRNYFLAALKIHSTRRAPKNGSNAIPRLRSEVLKPIAGMMNQSISPITIAEMIATMKIFFLSEWCSLFQIKLKH